MKITNLICDDNYDYYIHRSPDYEDVSFSDKANSFIENGIINIKNKDIGSSLLKIETNPDKLKKFSFQYYIDSELSFEEQCNQIFERKLPGLSYRKYAVIVKAEKNSPNSIIIPSEGNYKISRDNIVGVIYKEESVYDDKITYHLFESPYNKKKNEFDSKKYFSVPKEDDLTNNYSYHENKGDNVDIDDFLLSIVSEKSVGYDSSFKICASGKMFVSFERLKEMVNNGYNIISASKCGPFIEVEFEEVVKEETKRL